MRQVTLQREPSVPPEQVVEEVTAVYKAALNEYIRLGHHELIEDAETGRCKAASVGRNIGEELHAQVFEFLGAGALYVHASKNPPVGYPSAEAFIIGFPEGDAFAAALEQRLEELAAQYLEQ